MLPGFLAYKICKTLPNAPKLESAPKNYWNSNSFRSIIRANVLCMCYCMQLYICFCFFSFSLFKVL